MSDVIGYPELSLGLNNQKLALFGLFSKARSINKPLTLPLFCNFDAADGQHKLVPLQDVYSIGHLREFATAFGMTIIDEPPAETDNGWGCFIGGCERHGRDVKNGPGGLDDFTCQFFRNLMPMVATTPLFAKIQYEVFTARNVKLVLQLRIENDWAQEAVKLHTREQGFIDEFDLDFRQIIAKVHNSVDPSACRTIFVVSDETNMPVPKETIQTQIMHEFGISLIWKSDILSANELNTLSLLTKSTLDFEMAVRAPMFVGFSRSTFANLANFEAFCRQGHPAPAHYIYNNPGPMLLRRHDLGTGIDPRDVADQLISRAPLIGDTMDDCLWPAILTAHLSGHGDFTTSTGHISGARRGHLVAGVRGGGDRFIEGFSITFATPPPGGLEYRACLANGEWTDWTAPGEYAGTRDQSKSLAGFAARLTGPLSLAYDCLCIASFKDHGDLIITQGGEPCTRDYDCQLEAMQLVFHPRSAYATAIT